MDGIAVSTPEESLKQAVLHRRPLQWHLIRPQGPPPSISQILRPKEKPYPGIEHVHSWTLYPVPRGGISH